MTATAPQKRLLAPHSANAVCARRLPPAAALALQTHETTRAEERRLHSQRLTTAGAGSGRIQRTVAARVPLFVALVPCTEPTTVPFRPMQIRRPNVCSRLRSHVRSFRPFIPFLSSSLEEERGAHLACHNAPSEVQLVCLCRRGGILQPENRQAMAEAHTGREGSHQMGVE